MKNKKFALSALSLLFASNVFAADGHLVDIEYLDEDGVGFNSVEPYYVSGNPARTLGEARRNALEYAVEVLTTQFYAKQPFEWKVTFSSDVTDFTTYVGFVEALENMEASGVSHHFLNPVIEGQTQRNIYTNALYSAHMDEDVSVNPLSTFIPIDHRFELNNINDKNSMFNYVTETLIQAMGLTVTNNIHKQDIDSGDYAPEDKLVEFHKSYFDKFLVDQNGASLATMDYPQVVDAVNAGVYFTGFSQQTADYLTYNGIIDPETSMGIPMISSSTFVIPVPEESDSEVEKIEYHDNIDMVFSNTLSPVQRHTKGYPVVLDLGLAAYMLCDIGWCQTSATQDVAFNGKVMDLSVNVSSSDNLNAINANRGADIKFTVAAEDYAQYPVSSVVLDIVMSTELSIDTLNDPILNTSACEFGTVESEETNYQHIACSFDSLTESESVWLRVNAPNGGDYTISTRTYSNASNVDTYGLNNIQYQGVSFYLNGQENGAGGSDGKSGGSLGFLSLLLAIPFVFRRKKAL